MRNELIVTARAMVPFMSMFLVLLVIVSVLLATFFMLLSVESRDLLNSGDFMIYAESWLSSIYRLMINHNPMATKIIEKNVVRQPKFSIIFAPKAKPTTDPAANIELNTPTPIASFSLG